MSVQKGPFYDYVIQCLTCCQDVAHSVRGSASAYGENISRQVPEMFEASMLGDGCLVDDPPSPLFQETRMLCQESQQKLTKIIQRYVEQLAAASAVTPAVRMPAAASAPSGSQVTDAGSGLSVAVATADGSGSDSSPRKRARAAAFSGPASSGSIVSVAATAAKPETPAAASADEPVRIELARALPVSQEAQQSGKSSSGGVAASAHGPFGPANLLAASANGPFAPANLPARSVNPPGRKVQEMMKKFQAPSGSTVAEKVRLFGGKSEKPASTSSSREPQPELARSQTVDITPQRGQQNHLEPQPQLARSQTAGILSQTALEAERPSTCGSERSVASAQASSAQIPGSARAMAGGSAASNASGFSASSSNVVSGSGSLSQAGMTAADGRRIGDAKHAGSEACQRLADGRRRDDVAKPSSLRAAELSKQQEERRVREKQERERERSKAIAVAVPTSGSMASTSGTGATASASSSAPSAKPVPKAKPKMKQAHRRSATFATADGAPLQSQMEAPNGEVDAKRSVDESGLTDADSSVLTELGNIANGDGTPQMTPRKIRPPVPAFTQEKKPPEDWQILRQIPLPDIRPEDNYELSEHGENSDPDDAEEAARRAKKKVPRWCDFYLDFLQKQADTDPDTVFGSRVPECRMQDIFTDELYTKVGKKRPKRNRGSSQDWRRDRLAKGEIKCYKRKMGQTKGWMANMENMPPANQQLLAGAKRQSAVT